MPKSERRKAPHELLAALMADSSHAIISCSLDGTIQAWSRGAEEIYGLSREEALGAPATLHVPSDRLEEHERLVDEARAGRSVNQCDTVRVRKTGERAPVAVCAFPVWDEEGRVGGYATIEREITDRQRAADVLREALAQANEASAAKTRFLANVSHELRTPMNAIVGMTALALEEKLSPELRDYLETVRDSAGDMLQLINDVLDLARFESATFEPNNVTFDPRELVEETVRTFNHAARAKGLSLTCHVGRRTPACVVGDAVRLQQVLVNLVSNALKFTSSGGVEVRVTPTLFEKSRCRLEFRVVDTGIGISPEQRSRIFAPFTQGDGATTRAYRGAGLGLTITRHLVNCFGSELNVESQPGQGSCFWFQLSLPLADRLGGRPKPDAPCAPASDDDESAGSLFERPPARTLHVLLVEDTPANRKVVERVLSKRGHQVAAAENGREAVDAFRSRRFDVVLMDVQMPVMDGLQATEAIREIERSDGLSDGVPIVALTAHSMRGDRERCLRAGMNDFLAKPLSLQRLIRAVESSGDRGSRPPQGRRDRAARPGGPHQGNGVFDARAALARLRGDHTLLLEMIDFFAEDSARLRETIHQSATPPDLPRLQRAAHSLKALAATFEAASAVAAAQELEAAARESRADALPALINRLERETDRLSAALDSYKRSPTPD